ncbi:MAG TPA: type I-E CRISPR-associated protein Cse2/CasB [Thioploca sp.]|nr:type I-E CRISPR-associated protein Cse2/CasB [Thioploca sp.]
MKTQQPLDFVAVKRRFDGLRDGQKAEIRRAHWQDLDLVPAYYRLGIPPDKRWQRVVAMMPYVSLSHSEHPNRLGAALAKADIHERRLFQMWRSESPTDFDYLRRIIEQARQKNNLAIDWQLFGNSLFYWGENKKREIVQDFLAQYPQQKGN